MAGGAFVWALAIGFGLSVQVAMNAMLRTHFGNAAWAALVNFAAGTLVLAAFALVSRTPAPSGSQIAGVPAWAWIGGALGACYVISATILGPRIGLAALTALVVTGQLVASMVIDHYGLLGFAQNPVSALRIAGAVVLIVGVLMVTRG